MEEQQSVPPDDSTLTRDMKGELELVIAEETMRKQILMASHQHEFTYLLNNNHTALRGCKCGLAFVGLMAGPSPDALQWHQIHEENEQG